MHENDPLWRLRHALAGMGLALLVSVPLAAWLGRVIGDAVGGSYAWRAGVYAALLAYLVAGAVVLFARVARHETQRIGPGRLARWVVSLWLWPALLAAARKSAAPPDKDPGTGP